MCDDSTSQSEASFSDSPKRVFICQYCSAAFADSNSYEVHETFVHHLSEENNQVINAAENTNGNTNDTGVADELEDIANSTIYHDVNLGSPLFTNSEIVERKRTLRTKEEYSCDICHAGFVLQRNYIKHVKSHDEESENTSALEESVTCEASLTDLIVACANQQSKQSETSFLVVQETYTTLDSNALQSLLCGQQQSQYEVSESFTIVNQSSSKVEAEKPNNAYGSDTNTTTGEIIREQTENCDDNDEHSQKFSVDDEASLNVLQKNHKEKETSSMSHEHDNLDLIRNYVNTFQPPECEEEHRTDTQGEKNEFQSQLELVQYLENDPVVMLVQSHQNTIVQLQEDYEEVEIIHLQDHEIAELAQLENFVVVDEDTVLEENRKLNLAANSIENSDSGIHHHDQEDSVFTSKVKNATVSNSITPSIKTPAVTKKDVQAGKEEDAGSQLNSEASGSSKLVIDQSTLKKLLDMAVKNQSNEQHVQINNELKKSNDPEPIICGYCKMSFGSKTPLLKHLHQFHQEANSAPKVCGFCDQIYPNRRALQNHILLMHKMNPNQLQCMICQMTFKTTVALRRHEKCHNDTKGYQCQLCGLTFRGAQTLIFHMTKHHPAGINRKMLSCLACNKAFSYESMFENHLSKKHNVDKKYTKVGMKEVQSNIVSSSSQDEDKKTHPFKYQCNKCNTAFISERGILRHIEEIHQKNYECDLCQFKFLYNSHFQNHLKEHQNDQKYQCVSCDLVLPNIQCLRRHHKEKHAELNIHVYSDGNNALKCKICNVLVSTEFDIREHANLHFLNQEKQAGTDNLNYSRSSDQRKLNTSDAVAKEIVSFLADASEGLGNQDMIQKKVTLSKSWKEIHERMTELQKQLDTNKKCRDLQQTEEYRYNGQEVLLDAEARKERLYLLHETSRQTKEVANALMQSTFVCVFCSVMLDKTEFNCHIDMHINSLHSNGASQNIVQEMKKVEQKKYTCKKRKPKKSKLSAMVGNTSSKNHTLSINIDNENGECNDVFIPKNVRNKQRARKPKNSGRPTNPENKIDINNIMSCGQNVSCIQEEIEECIVVIDSMIECENFETFANTVMKEGTREKACNENTKDVTVSTVTERTEIDSNKRVQEGTREIASIEKTRDVTMSTRTEIAEIDSNTITQEETRENVTEITEIDSNTIEQEETRQNPSTEYKHDMSTFTNMAEIESTAIIQEGETNTSIKNTKDMAKSTFTEIAEIENSLGSNFVQSLEENNANLSDQFEEQELNWSIQNLECSGMVASLVQDECQSQDLQIECKQNCSTAVDLVPLPIESISQKREQEMNITSSEIVAHRNDVIAERNNCKLFSPTRMSTLPLPSRKSTRHRTKTIICSCSEYHKNDSATGKEHLEHESWKIPHLEFAECKVDVDMIPVDEVLVHRDLLLMNNCLDESDVGLTNSAMIAKTGDTGRNNMAGSDMVCETKPFKDIVDSHVNLMSADTQNDEKHSPRGINKRQSSKVKWNPRITFKRKRRISASSRTHFLNAEPKGIRDSEVFNDNIFEKLKEHQDFQIKIPDDTEHEDIEAVVITEDSTELKTTINMAVVVYHELNPKATEGTKIVVDNSKPINFEKLVLIASDELRIEPNVNNCNSKPNEPVEEVFESKLINDDEFTINSRVIIAGNVESETSDSATATCNIDPETVRSLIVEGDRKNNSKAGGDQVVTVIEEQQIRSTVNEEVKNESTVTEAEQNLSIVIEEGQNQSIVTWEEQNQSTVNEKEQNESTVIEEEQTQSIVTEEEQTQSSGSSTESIAVVVDVANSFEDISSDEENKMVTTTDQTNNSYSVKPCHVLVDWIDLANIPAIVEKIKKAKETKFVVNSSECFNRWDPTLTTLNQSTARLRSRPRVGNSATSLNEKTDINSNNLVGANIAIKDNPVTYDLASRKNSRRLSKKSLENTGNFLDTLPESHHLKHYIDISEDELLKPAKKLPSKVPKASQALRKFKVSRIEGIVKSIKRRSLERTHEEECKEQELSSGVPCDKINIVDTSSISRNPVMKVKLKKLSQHDIDAYVQTGKLGNCSLESNASFGKNIMVDSDPDLVRSCMPGDNIVVDPDQVRSCVPAVHIQVDPDQVRSCISEDNNVLDPDQVRSCMSGDNNVLDPNQVRSYMSESYVTTKLEHDGESSIRRGAYRISQLGIFGRGLPNSMHIRSYSRLPEEKQRKQLNDSVASGISQNVKENVMSKISVTSPKEHLKHAGKLMKQKKLYKPLKRRFSLEPLPATSTNPTAAIGEQRNTLNMTRLKKNRASEVLSPHLKIRRLNAAMAQCKEFIVSKKLRDIHPACRKPSMKSKRGEVNASKHNEVIVVDDEISFKLPLSKHEILATDNFFLTNTVDRDHVIVVDDEVSFKIPSPCLNLHDTVALHDMSVRPSFHMPEKEHVFRKKRLLSRKRRRFSMKVEEKFEGNNLHKRTVTNNEEVMKKAMCLVSKHETEEGH